MHASWAAAIIAAMLGVDVGWQPLEDGTYEYIIQIEPELAARLDESYVLEVGVLPEMRNVSRYRIIVGRAVLPRKTRPGDAPASANSRPSIAEPGVATTDEVDGASSSAPAWSGRATAPTPSLSDAPSYQPPPLIGSEPDRPSDSATETEPDTQTGRGTGLLKDPSRPKAPTLLGRPEEEPVAGDTPTEGAETDITAPTSDDPPAAEEKTTGDSAVDEGSAEEQPVEETPASGGYAPPPSTPGGYSPPPSTTTPSTTPPSTTPYAPPSDTTSVDPLAPTDVASTDVSSETSEDTPLAPRTSVAENFDTAKSAEPEKLRPWDGQVAHTSGHDPGHDQGSGDEEEAAASVAATDNSATGPAAAPVTAPSADTTAEPGKPWGLLIGSWFLLFISVGANAFLVWIAWEARSRLKALLDRTQLTHSPAGA